MPAVGSLFISILWQMAEKKFFNRSKRFYIFSGIVVILLAAGFLFWRDFKYKLVNRKLNQLVTGKSRGLYQISYEHLIIDEALGNISVENIELLPDSSVYKLMIADNTAPISLFYIRIPALHITGVKTPKALLNKEISAHIIHIENAEIEFRLGKSNSEKKPDISGYLDGSFYRQLLGRLVSIKADSIVLENANITLTDKQSHVIRSRATGLSIRFASTSIDSTTQNESSRILYSKEISLHCNHFELPSKNKIYDLEISGLDYNSQNAGFHTDQVRLKPRLSEAAFAASHKYAKDRFDISVAHLDLRNINRYGLLHQQLIADSLQIMQASLRIFRDKSVPNDSVDRTHDFPQEAIMSLPLPLYIRKIIIKDSYIEYKEKNDKSDSSGKVAFFHVQAGLENVTNIPDSIRIHKQMRLVFNASFLNASPFSVVMNLRLNDKQGHFQLDAKLGSLDGSSLNALLKPMALAEMNKGKINKLIYHMEANNISVKGDLILLYNNLSVKLLKKDDKKNKYKTKVFSSLAAGLLLKKSNPQNGKTRIGNIDYTRDIHRSIFNFMWKSLFSGIKQVAL